MSSWDGRLPPLEATDDTATLDQLLALLELREHERMTEWCVTFILPDVDRLRGLIIRRFGAIVLRAHDAQAEIRRARNS